MWVAQAVANQTQKEPISDKVRLWFDAIAQAEGWRCKHCDRTIEAEDAPGFFEKGRCAACQSIDTSA